MAAKKSATLRWSRQPRETGLRAVGAGPRGWILWWGSTKLASVNVLFKGFSRDTDGWYFVARADELGIPLHNTCSVRGRPADDVRAECVEHVMTLLRARYPDVTFKVPTRCPDAEAYL